MRQNETFSKLSFACIYSYSFNFHKKQPPSEIIALIHIFSSSVLQFHRDILFLSFFYLHILSHYTSKWKWKQRHTHIKKSLSRNCHTVPSLLFSPCKHEVLFIKKLIAVTDFWILIQKATAEMQFVPYCLKWGLANVPSMLEE